MTKVEYNKQKLSKAREWGERRKAREWGERSKARERGEG
jgi:hypothetical protein